MDKPQRPFQLQPIPNSMFTTKAHSHKRASCGAGFCFAFGGIRGGGPQQVCVPTVHRPARILGRYPMLATLVVALQPNVSVQSA
jgi:hypothetical protein